MTTITPLATNGSNGSNGIHNLNGSNGIHTSNGSNGTHNSNGSNGTTDTTTTTTTNNSNPLESYHASLAQRLYVQRSSKAFSSAAISRIALPRGALFARLDGTTAAPKAYSTVQVGRAAHVELHSDLLYCNHSCAPTLEFDVARMEVRVARGRELRVGDPLTFWYPSTEWEMAQPFKCTCRSEACKDWISGAGQMAPEVLSEYWLNEHIVEMLKERESDEANAKGNGVGNGVH